MVTLSNPVATYREWWRERRVPTRDFLWQYRKWIIALLVLNYLDYLTTLIAINTGFRELNPIQGAMQYPVLHEVQKLIVLPAIMVALIGFFNARIALWLVLFSSVLVLIYNTQGLVTG